jgi:quinoprotein dehydrogenase-associated probable ABC transporter substrate-binding protein
MTAARGIVVAVLLMAGSVEGHPPDRVLRVCADPNNLPFSSDRTPGFENQIAEVLARSLGAKLEYTWWAQRRGFFRNTLKAKSCDVVIGVPVGLGMARTTAPYYRSSYAFVSRAERRLAVHSLDDPRLHTWKIGVQLVGDDGVNTPPVHALARRGIVDNVVGYTVFGDYTRESPPADVMRAVVDGSIDVAIVWGPLAGGFAKSSPRPLAIAPVDQAVDAGLAMAFDIAIGVRRPDREFAAELDRVLIARRAQIHHILAAWGVPAAAPPAPASADASTGAR